MKPFCRGEPLWHVSDKIYAPAQSIGPHRGPSPHWLNSRTNPWWATFEDILERIRPSALVSRMTCLFATDSPVQVGRMVKTRPGALVYRVDVPAHAQVCGRFDLQLVNIRLNAWSAAREYWAGNFLNKDDVRPEVLATELVVVACLGEKFSADIRTVAAARDLTMAELERGVVFSAPTATVKSP